MEPNGKISFLPKSKFKPVTPNDIKLKIPYKGICTNVIIDGNIMINNLKSINKTKEWLLTRLEKLNYKRIENLLLVTIDTNEKISIYEKNIPKKTNGNFE